MVYNCLQLRSERNTVHVRICAAFTATVANFRPKSRSAVVFAVAVDDCGPISTHKAQYVATNGEMSFKTMSTNDDMIM